MTGQGKHRVLHTVRTYADGLVSAVLPERCALCGVLVQGGGLGRPSTLCSECLSRIHLVSGPVCNTCGWPLPPDMLCSCCPGYASISRRRFAMEYGDGAAEVILRLKYGDRPELSRRLALWMYQAGQELCEQADVLVPVPIHWSRLLMRQYNQAAEIARHLSVLAKVPVDTVRLRRVRATPSQGRKTRKERRQNVAGAFALSMDKPFLGKRVLLIDDVATTGATADACAQIIREGGAAQVDLLTAASARNT